MQLDRSWSHSMNEWLDGYEVGESRVLSRLIWGSCDIYQRINYVSNRIFWWRRSCQPKLSLFLLARHLHYIHYISQPPSSEHDHMPMLPPQNASRTNVHSFQACPIKNHQQVPFYVLTYSDSWKQMITRFWRKQVLEDFWLKRTLCHWLNMYPGLL